MKVKEIITTAFTTRRGFLAALGGAAVVADNPFHTFAQTEEPQVLHRIDALTCKSVLTIVRCRDPQFGCGFEERKYERNLARFEKELELVDAAFRYERNFVGVN